MPATTHGTLIRAARAVVSAYTPMITFIRLFVKRTVVKLALRRLIEAKSKIWRRRAGGGVRWRRAQQRAQQRAQHRPQHRAESDESHRAKSHRAFGSRSDPPLSDLIHPEQAARCRRLGVERRHEHLEQRLVVREHLALAARVVGHADEVGRADALQLDWVAAA